MKEAKVYNLWKSISKLPSFNWGIEPIAFVFSRKIAFLSAFYLVGKYSFSQNNLYLVDN